jgi:hypothetical protein
MMSWQAQEQLLLQLHPDPETRNSCAIEFHKVSEARLGSRI